LEVRIVAANSALAARLKSETAALHLSTEQLVGLPHSVRTRGDYFNLLIRLLAFHHAFEASMRRSIWSSQWSAIGITLSEHDRSPLLVDDLLHLDAPTTPEVAEVPEFATFAQALGGLYVIEGSALGGRVLGPAFRSYLGELPSRFYDSEGRNHPHPWRSVQAALTRFDERGGNGDEVLLGAAATFNKFGNHCAASRWQMT